MSTIDAVSLSLGVFGVLAGSFQVWLSFLFYKLAKADQTRVERLWENIYQNVAVVTARTERYSQTIDDVNQAMNWLLFTQNAPPLLRDLAKDPRMPEEAKKKIRLILPHSTRVAAKSKREGSETTTIIERVAADLRLPSAIVREIALKVASAPGEYRLSHLPADFAYPEYISAIRALAAAGLFEEENDGLVLKREHGAEFADSVAAGRSTGK